MWAICISFGLTLGVSIYIIGFLLGSHLDEKFNTYPTFVIIGTLFAIIGSFYRLFLDLKVFPRRGAKNKQNSKGNKEK